MILNSIFELKEFFYGNRCTHIFRAKNSKVTFRNKEDLKAIPSTLGRPFCKMYKALAMSPPVEQPKRKDDRLSLVDQPAPVLWSDGQRPFTTFAQDAAVMSQEFKEYQQQQRQNYDEPENLLPQAAISHGHSHHRRRESSDFRALRDHFQSVNLFVPPVTHHEFHISKSNYCKGGYDLEGLISKKVPNDDSFLNIDSLSGNPEFSSTHSQVAVKTSCGHVIGKAEGRRLRFQGQ
ncbi:COesterase domain-containing protein [Caerostris extrusa]|uniref:COesterase domain-containing protein n=1 Tax=Caerostris extrusa TaxID=172846 RepID=A0AAV4N278_CAEEX|nr:COesterase domain-containing protein [Caerostris extrusa]